MIDCEEPIRLYDVEGQWWLLSVLRRYPHVRPSVLLHVFARQDAEGDG